MHCLKHKGVLNNYQLSCFTVNVAFVPVDKVNVTISLGVSTFPDNAQTPQDLIEWADKGLYYAKEHGRNQVGRY